VAEKTWILDTLEDDVEEVLQRGDKGVDPVLAEVNREDRVVFGTLEKRQAVPLLPLVLRLQLVGVVFKELDGLVGFGGLDGVDEVIAK